jgi:hypothetical protein
MRASRIDPEDPESMEGQQDDETRAGDEWQPARSEEREQRQHTAQPNGDSFAVDGTADPNRQSRGFEHIPIYGIHGWTHP